MTQIAPDDAYWPGAWHVQVASDLGVFRILVIGEPSSEAVRLGDRVVVAVCRSAP